MGCRTLGCPADDASLKLANPWLVFLHEAGGEMALTSFTRRSVIALGSSLIALTGFSACAHEPAQGAGGTASYLASLRATSVTPITHEEYAVIAASLQVETAALEAAAFTEGGRGSGYDANGRPLVLFEPHIFSRRTNRRFDESHPTISYPALDGRRYPATQDERWAQVEAAYELAPDEALESTSWGAFQLMGYNYRGAGFENVRAFVTALSTSPQQQLAAWARWLTANGLVDELQRKDWAGFARGYNGPGYAASNYDRRMADEYARLTAAAN